MKPTSAEEVAEVVGSASRVCPVGARTKSGLLGEGEEIDLKQVSGITEYEASEYTFTARAGTTVAEVAEALRDKGQYLPFDPLFVEAGATLGGTVAAGISGPGRFRYGGIRDFLIGVQFVDGAGQLVRSGGKVVKNAAGFDLPKFFVGSLGRFGILTELSFKVFPAPFETVTLAIACAEVGVAVERMVEISCSRWEADALDFNAQEKEIYVRLGGPGKALRLLAKEAEGRWPGEVREVEDDVWRVARELTWAEKNCLAKVALSPSRLESLENNLGDVEQVARWYSSGSAVGWLSYEASSTEKVDRALRESGLAGLQVRGERAGGVRLGKHEDAEIFERVKRALDPNGRFAAIY